MALHRKSILLALLAFSLYAPAVFNAPASKTRPAKARPQAAAGTMVDAMLRSHNEIRGKFNLPPLQWSSQLAAYSQKWANTLALKNRSAHNPNSPYGENIFITGPGATPAAVVREWASESADYNHRTNQCATDCGHFTQIVWRSSKKLGCAVARGSGREVWVCSYDPPGNWSNEWPY